VCPLSLKERRNRVACSCRFFVREPNSRHARAFDALDQQLCLNPTTRTLAESVILRHSTAGTDGTGRLELVKVP